MVILKIIMNALPEKRREVLQTLQSLTSEIRREKGCRSYQVFQDVEDETVFSLIGEWETHEDMEHHIRSDRFGVLLGSKILLNENQDIEIHTVSHTEGSGFANAIRSGRI
jgi:quinol monooxygenase YgiN